MITLLTRTLCVLGQMVDGDTRDELMHNKPQSFGDMDQLRHSGEGSSLH